MQEGLEEIFWEFIEEGQEFLTGLENSLSELEENPENSSCIDEAFRCIHTLKGNSSCFELENLTGLAHALEDVLGKVRDKKLTMSSDLLQDLIEGVDKIGLMLGEPENIESVECEDIIKRCEKWLGGKECEPVAEASVEAPKAENPFGHIKRKTHNFLYWMRLGSNDGSAFEDELSQMGEIHEKSEGEGFIDYLYETVLDQTFFEMLDFEIAVIEEHNANEEEIIEKKKESIKEEKSKSSNNSARQESFARINYQLLDKLIELSGELILCRNQFVRRLDQNLTQDFHALSTLINDMQDGLMMTRMQPFSIVSAKFPRMVRDTARKLGKKISFDVDGDWIEMDRTILEGAKSIFTHLVRNSLDHGIEMPEKRVTKGKKQEGKLKIAVSQNTGFVQFVISDDGGGIDPEKLKEKALSKGIITQQQSESMADDKALNLIYAPGFSTSGNVTDISGRGVGMDVVKTEVEKLGGSIHLESRLGEGTSFTIKLPQSMAILHSLVVRAHNQSYAIPRNNISEVIKINSSVEDSFQEVEGSTMLKHRGRLLPLLDLNTMITHSLTKGRIQEAKKIDSSVNPLTIIVIKQMEKSYGLIVEEVQYQEEVVIKPLNEFLEAFEIFTGMTILSTGKVCFILDVQSLAEKGGIRHTDVVSISGERTNGITTEPYFVFENRPMERFAIPIGQVAMIHHVPVEELAKCGTEYFINVLEDEYKVIDLADFVNCTKENLYDNETAYIIRLKGILGKWVIICRKLIGTEDFPIDLNFLKSQDRFILGNIIQQQTVTNFLDILMLDKEVSGKPLEANKSKILIVDDSRLSRKMIYEFLIDSGFEVFEAENGIDALQKIKQIDGLSLVMSDIEMPKMDGFEMVTSLRGENNLDIPVIALTSLNSKNIRDKALHAGFNELVLKFDTKNIVETLRRYTA